MKKTMKKTAAALCIAATLVSVAAPAMAVSPAEYMSTAALEECNTATVAQVESLINQIGTVTTARRPAIVAAVNAYNELDDASKAQVSNFAVLAEAQQVLGLKDALAKLKISYDKVEDARSYVSPTEDRLSNQGKSYILPFFVNGSTNDPYQYVVLQVTLKEKFIGTGSGNLTELENVINQQAAKGYRLHTITTANGGSKGLMGGDRIQATMVFEKVV